MVDSETTVSALYFYSPHHRCNLPPTKGRWQMLNHIEKSLDHIIRHHPHSHTAIMLLGHLNRTKDTPIKSHYQLKQLVTSARRRGAILAKLYTNADTFYTRTEVTATLGLSDHEVVTCYLALSDSCRAPFVDRVSYRQHEPMDKALFVEALSSVHWEPMYHLPTCKEQVSFFNNTMTLLDTYLRITEVKRCSNDRPWINDWFRTLIKKRQHALKAGQTALYRVYHNKVNRARKPLQRNHYQAKVQDLGDQRSRQWWHDISTLIGCQKMNTNFQAMANTLCDGNLQLLVNKIWDSFHSVRSGFSALTEEDTFVPPASDCSVPDKIVVSVADVERKLIKVCTDKAMGLDSIPNWVLWGLCGPPVQAGVLIIQQQSLGWFPTLAVEICRCGPPLESITA